MSLTGQEQQRAIASVNERQWGDGNPGATLLRQFVYTWGSLFFLYALHLARNLEL
jgi:hypothetical protein